MLKPDFDGLLQPLLEKNKSIIEGYKSNTWERWERVPHFKIPPSKDPTIKDRAHAKNVFKQNVKRDDLKGVRGLYVYTGKCRVGEKDDEIADIVLYSGKANDLLDRIAAHSGAEYNDYDGAEKYNVFFGFIGELRNVLQVDVWYKKLAVVNEGEHGKEHFIGECLRLSAEKMLQAEYLPVFNLLPRRVRGMTREEFGRVVEVQKEFDQM
jgi:hypothetical protein